MRDQKWRISSLAVLLLLAPACSTKQTSDASDASPDVNSVGQSTDAAPQVSANATKDAAPADAVDREALAKLVELAGMDIQWSGYAPDVYLTIEDAAVNEEGLLDAAIMDELNKVTEKFHLSIYTGRVTDGVLEQLCKLKHVKHVVLTDAGNITGAGLLHVAKCQDVVSLYINGAVKIVDADFEPLGKLPKLTHFLVYRCPKLDGSFLAFLSATPKLTNVTIDSCGTTDAGLAQAHVFPSLEEFELDANSLSGSGLGFLASAKRLSSLWLKCGDLGDDAIKHIEGLPKLKRLHIGLPYRYIAITDESMKIIAALPKLEQLIIRATLDVSDAGIAHLAEMKNLKELSLVGVMRITDDALAEIAKIENLQNLEIIESPVADSGLDSLKPLAQLKSLTFRRTNITQAGVDQLKESMPNLTHVNFE